MLKYLTPPAVCLLAALVSEPASAEQPLVMESHVVRDSMAVNKEAMTFLKPRGWSVNGGVKWYHDLAHLACVELKISNPDGLEMIEALPWAYCTWLSKPIIPMRRGSNYMGSIVMPPIEDPKEVIRTLTLPQLRGRDARIVSSQDLPKVAQEISKAIGGSKVRSSRVRVEYSVNGQAVEEDFYLSIFVNATNLGFDNSLYQWGPAWMPFSLRAAKGRLDAATPMMPHARE